MPKRISIRNRYYIVSRRKNGTIKNIRRWRLSKEIKERIRITKILKLTLLQLQQRRAKNKVSSRTNKQFSKIKKSEFIISGKGRTLLSRATGVHQIERDTPAFRKKGQLWVRFLFIKGRQLAERTGTSSKMFLAGNTSDAFNQCYRKALGQGLPFSPDSVQVKSVKYVYWEKSP